MVAFFSENGRPHPHPMRSQSPSVVFHSAKARRPFSEKKTTDITPPVLNHAPMHIGQPSINPVALHGEPGVVESQLVQDGGVDVVDWGG